MSAPLLPILLLGLVTSVPHDDDPKVIARTRLGPSANAAAGALGSAAGTTYEASGVQLLAQVDLATLGVSTAGTDCWGYVSPSGREYAVMCTEESTVFVEVTVPSAPVVIGQIAGPVGVWRDAKTYDEYCYVVCETGCSGVQVIDLTQIDAGTVTLAATINGAGGGSSHNVAIDEVSGFLYRIGGDSGLKFYSLANPTNPTYVGGWGDRYVHDAQIVTYTSGPHAGKEIAFCCSGFNGGWVSPGLTIVDVTNKANPTVMSQVDYPDAAYSHQGWLTSDKQYFLLGDELDEYSNGLLTTTHVIDVSDPDNAFSAGLFDTPNPAVTHNLYTRGDLMFAANYSSGLRVFDVSDAQNGVEVAYFDTRPEDDAVDFLGLWSCYPYLPSGIVLGSDRARGLFIWWVGDDERVGTTYCAPAVANSTGGPAHIVATGSAVALDNDLTLSAHGMPAGQFGYFLGSQSQGTSNQPGGSQGVLCVSGIIARFNQPVLQSDASGTFQTAIDLSAVPVNPRQAVVAGETWSFQGWFRDMNPNATSNFTSGVEVLFQ